MIAVSQIAQLAPRCDAASWAPALDAAAARYDINTDLRTAHFLAQLYEESGGFTVFAENLNYSAAALQSVWPTHFPPPLNQQYGRLPQKIANRAYADRMGNGDEASGDGWKFRGRGPLQITGHDAYAAAAQAINVDLLGNPDLLLDPVNGALSAGAYWLRNDCNDLADRNDIVSITKRINGGLINLDHRQAAFASARAIWPN